MVRVKAIVSSRTWSNVGGGMGVILAPRILLLRLLLWPELWLGDSVGVAGGPDGRGTWCLGLGLSSEVPNDRKRRKLALMIRSKSCAHGRKRRQIARREGKDNVKECSVRPGHIRARRC